MQSEPLSSQRRNNTGTAYAFDKECAACLVSYVILAPIRVGNLTICRQSFRYVVKVVSTFVVRDTEAAQSRALPVPILTIRCFPCRKIR